MSCRIIPLLLLLSLSSTAQLVCAANIGTTEVGVRVGISVGDENEHFKQYEAFASRSLPWVWRWSSDWALETKAAVTAGTLRAAGRNGLITTIGPALALGNERWGIALTLGSSPTYISRDNFGDKRLGGHVQFVSYLGIRYRFNKNWHVGYRFQHMSNAGLQDNNPGLEIQALELGYDF